jgi:hypothetical protein
MYASPEFGPEGGWANQRNELFAEAFIGDVSGRLGRVIVLVNCVALAVG